MLFAFLFLLDVSNAVFSNYKNGCLLYSTSFPSMEDTFEFLYFALGILYSHVLR